MFKIPDQHRTMAQCLKTVNSTLSPGKLHSYISTILLPVILLMLIQICHSYETHQPFSNQRLSYDRTHSPYDANPIVFNPNSLYKSRSSSGGTRTKRSAQQHQHQHQRPQPPVSQNQKFVDACQSKMEVLTPYYATNSKGKLRTIVNSELMQQAIQVETCTGAASSASSQTSAPTNRCNTQPDCACEQKYKWHRLLVLDATNEPSSSSKGLFMDWFLFPSNCVCRCKTGLHSTKNFLKTMMTLKRS